MYEMIPRKVIDLNSDWKFCTGQHQNAWNRSYDDSDWQSVILPHDWSVSYPFDQNNSSGTGYLPGGTGFYRKRFKLDPSDREKRAILTFDGVYKNAQVWINGYYLGRRPSGYSTFSYNISEFLHTDEKENLLAVRVTHEDVADSRWYTGSGIYRKVTMTLTGQPAIDVNGLFIHTEHRSGQVWDIVMDSRICDDRSDLHLQVKLRHQIFNSNGHMVAQTGNDDVTLSNESPIRQVVQIIEPDLWSPESPVLYQCVTTVQRDHTVTDCQTTVFGIREFSFDSQQGFFLNGQSMKIKGVCVHHDAGNLGAAVWPSVWRRRLDILKISGCNAIRMSHNPHMPELYDLCDQMGFLVIDEAFDEWEGIKNKWVHGHNVYPPNLQGYAEEFPQWYQADLRSMVLRDRNHPSVILWSIGNEVDYPNDPYVHPAFARLRGNNDHNKPKQELSYDDSKPNADRLTVVARKLKQIVRDCDPTRPVTAALAAPELSNLTGLTDVLDVAGYNYKENRYDDDHQRYPERVILGTENSKSPDKWMAVQSRAYISGLFLWTGFDFLGETRGWPLHGSEAGLLDTAGFCKPEFYLWQSLWSDQPVLKLFASQVSSSTAGRVGIDHQKLSRSWNFSGQQPVQILCLTNLDDVELSLNDRVIGRQQSLADQHWLSFETIWESGRLTATGYDRQGRQASDSIISTGPVVAIRGQFDREPLGSESPEIAHLIIELIDCDGHRVLDADHKLHVQVEGRLRLLALENGDQSDNTPSQSSERRARRGRLLAYIASDRQSDEATVVTISTDDLPALKMTLPG